MANYVTVTPLPGIPAIDELSYSVPDDLAGAVVPGARVIVPLGSRRVTALVTKCAAEPPAGVDCRDIASVLDHEPVVPGDLLELMEWMAEYYLAARADVLSLVLGRGLTAASKRLVTLLDAGVARNAMEKDLVAVLAATSQAMEPRALARRLAVRSVDRAVSALAARGGVEVRDVLAEPKVKAQFETFATVTRLPDAITAEALFRRAPRRREIFEYLADLPGRSATVAELGSVFPSPASPLRALADAGLVRMGARESYREPEAAVESAPPPQATAAQTQAIDAVSARLGAFAPFLLQGVTASGKTEVYLRLIETVLGRGQSALVLVPEISLTHQVLARLKGRFGDAVAVLHSALSAGERWDQWRRICRGEARVAIGARSAVLAPMIRLGLIVVDEEHDGSYKQEDGVRYHGRDVAVRRAQLAGCPVLLGSATPSLESWRNAAEGRYSRLLLGERVTANPLPRVTVADLRGQDLVARGGITEYLAEQMSRNFADGGQTLLFLNRRGYARNLQCYQCGEVIECADCSVGMTLHQESNELRCHHCNAWRRSPRACPSCSADALVSQGLGTQRLESTVREILPKARVARLDRDSTARKGRSGSILLDWRHHRVDVLIGTQMIAKGHDVPGVTLVGVVHADLALTVPDFRAAERTFQLLSQVAGRAGRGERRGHVVVQTYQPEHPAIVAAAAHDYEGFAAAELADREELGYPPTSRMVQLRMIGPDRAAAERVAAAAARAGEEISRAVGGVALRGPAPSAIERVKGNFRFQIQLRGASGAAVRHVAALLRSRTQEAARKSGVRVTVDVDPLDMV